MTTAAPMLLTYKYRKREWFAGQALAGLCSGTYRYTSTAEEIARLSYFLADAMISEGNKDGTE